MNADNKGAMARPLVIAALVIYLGTVLFAVFWHGDREQELRIAAVVIAVYLANLVLLMIGAWPAKVRTPGLLVVPGIAFAAPHERRYGYGLASQALGQAGVTWMLTHVIGPPFFPTLAPGAGQAVAIAIVVLLVIGGVLTVWTCVRSLVRPALLLTPAGLRWDNGRRSRRLDWVAIAPGQPHVQPDPDSLMVYLSQPRPSGRLWSRVGLRYVRIDVGYLAAMIRFYVDHPERRAAIGSQAEYDDLMRVLAGAPVPS
jgi:hypothetical protein